MLKIIDDGNPLSAPLHTAYVDVRWGDLDADGHVNNATLLGYAEEARMQWSAALALGRSAPGLMSVVASQACSYRAPVGYPARLAVTLRCGHVGNSSVGLVFDLRDAADERVAYARAAITWVWVDRGDKRPRPMPSVLRAACTAAFDAT
ncbi:acyl-CoA thioesterase [Achromobacter aloeverae]|uniref:Acyl-CoA thioesterase n=1 Tax=Achromobacter aloeverae TaxID=1750518 RepID=A0A4Q1HLI4_9BURK|nr:acyl-CoA thioesterase [Achromobacter aloeverae]RXN91323.1 acyl-CoA thioesterase [Achromobacter aloeverae]